MAEIVERPRSSRDVAKDIARRFLRHENGVLIIALMVLIVAMAAVTKGLIISRINVINVLVQSSALGLAAIGQAFVILTAGIDLSIEGVSLFASILGGGLMTERTTQNFVGYPVSPFIAVPIMLLVATIWGVINGSVVSRIGMPALIVTLGIWQISSGAAYYLVGGASVGELPQLIAFFGQTRFAGVPVPVIIFAAVGVIAYFILNHTTYGRSIYAVGGNAVSAWLSGINVRNTRFSVYIISGFLSGLAGLTTMGRTLSVTMKTNKGLMLDSIAAATVGGTSLMGGRGNIIGVVVGTLIIGIISNAVALLWARSDVEQMVMGAIIITAVAVDYIRRR